MNVHLTPPLEQLVQTKVKSGRYNSASEVVREALRLLEERDQLTELRKEVMRQQIDEGWNALRRGEGVDGEQLLADLEASSGCWLEPRPKLARVDQLPPFASSSAGHPQHYWTISPETVATPPGQVRQALLAALQAACGASRYGPPAEGVKDKPVPLVFGLLLAHYLRPGNHTTGDCAGARRGTGYRHSFWHARDNPRSTRCARRPAARAPTVPAPPCAPGASATWPSRLPPRASGTPAALLFHQPCGRS